NRRRVHLAEGLSYEPELDGHLRRRADLVLDGFGLLELLAAGSIQENSAQEDASGRGACKGGEVYRNLIGAFLHSHRRGRKDLLIRRVGELQDDIPLLGRPKVVGNACKKFRSSGNEKRLGT